MASQWRGGPLFVILTLLSLSLAYAETGSPDRRAAGSTESSVEVRHLQEQDGWRVAETVNFRLWHQHSHSLAEAVLRTAERTRATQLRKWFGEIGVRWEPKCRIYLYASGEDYGAATGAPVQWGGGHTDIRTADGRVIGRSIHVYGSQTFVLKGVVPHEVTHAVLAGRLGNGRVPRWADEGMAILAEAPAHIAMHLRFLPRWHADDALYPTRTLVEMRDYPEPHALGVFYAQSVSLVEFLTRQKGAERFAAFVRDGERNGYAAALHKHYGWNFAELDRRWRQHAFYEKNAAEPTSGGG
jgi:hypothetical protein